MEYRTKLFYFGCVPVRIAIATIFLLGINPKVGPVSIFGILATFMAIGFLVNHYNNKKTGFFGGNAWWHGFRPFHAGLWTIVAILLFFDARYAGILVLYDLLPGTMEVCRGVNK
tara:strand:+ start:12792 stop:13133 length:342 start_codon:yes stop_codon:yes gene_type:complete